MICFTVNKLFYSFLLFPNLEIRNGHVQESLIPAMFKLIKTNLL